MRVEWRPPASAASPSRGADKPCASPWSGEVGRGPSSISRCAIPVPQEQSQCQQLGAIKHNLQFSGQCKHCSQQLQALLLPGVAGLLAADAGLSGAAHIPPCPSPKVKKDCTRITRGGDQGKHLSGFLITFLLSAFWVMKHVFMPGLPSVQASSITHQHQRSPALSGAKSRRHRSRDKLTDHCRKVPGYC